MGLYNVGIPMGVGPILYASDGVIAINVSVHCYSTAVLVFRYPWDGLGSPKLLLLSHPSVTFYAIKPSPKISVPVSSRLTGPRCVIRALPPTSLTHGLVTSQNLVAVALTGSYLAGHTMPPPVTHGRTTPVPRGLHDALAPIFWTQAAVQLRPHRAFDH